MFESLELKAAGYGADDILKAIDALKHAQVAAANELLVWAAAWADAHPAESIMDNGVAGTAQAVRPGGEGTPFVNDLAMAEFFAKLGKGANAGMKYLAEVLDLRHRLPLLWDRVMHCRVEEWQARKVARMTHDLSVELAGQVDRKVAWFAGTQPYGKLVEAVEAEILRCDGDRVRKEYQHRKQQLGAWLSRTDEYGHRAVFGQLQPLAANRLYARVQEVADCLDEGTADERRATAFGMLADPAATIRLLARRRQPDLFDEELADAVADLTEDDPDVIVEESEVHPALRDRPTTTDVESAIFQGAVERIVERLDPKFLRPTTTVVVHLAAEDLGRSDGVCRIPDLGPVLKSVVGEWLGHDRVVVRPVIDLNDVPPPVDDYEIPDRYRDHVLHRNPGSVFPWSTATCGLDLDHTVPFQHKNGPPGQTTAEGLYPYSRFEHRALTHGGWARRKPDPTTVIFRSPHGNVYLTNRSGTHDLGVGPEARALWNANAH